MATVEYRNICKLYADGTVALSNFDLKINDGEFVVLVGPSGCGKSTALRLLAGLEEVTQGEILIDGEIINQRSPQQRNIAMVFQNYALYPHMTVRKNLEFPLKMASTTNKQRSEKIAEIAAMLNLVDQLDRKPSQLSGGQRQRVAMGRSLVRNPSIFLLDEPLSNLDAQQRAQIRAEIAKLQKDLHKTTLYVTHDQVEAMTLGDRVAVLEDGKLHQVGTPLELYSKPRSTFVARFIGSPGMNIFSTPLLCNKDKKWQVQFAGRDVILPTEKISHRHSLQTSQRIFVGFRPESVRTRPGAESIECTVKVAAIEFLGHETLLYFQLQEKENIRPLIARVPGRFSSIGEKVKIFIPVEALYFFTEDGSIIE